MQFKRWLENIDNDEFNIFKNMKFIRFGDIPKDGFSRKGGAIKLKGVSVFQQKSLMANPLR